ncbi:MAG: NAD(P)/FAD-dependent oxidoreductase [Firmicutes bacterium]|nr:NAD(P)/FAD-dependent oxidoreductase [Bacillota bacterium]
MSKKIYDVAVIGAGVTGAFIARELAKYKVSTILLEEGADVANGASRANSAIVHAGFDAIPGTLKAKLNLRGSQMMERITKELGVKYRRNGSLVIGDKDEKSVIEMLYDRGKQTGVPDMRIIGREELHKLEPNLVPQAEWALWAQTGAITCTYGLTIAAVGNAMDNGVELKCGYKLVSAERQEDGSFLLISESGEKVYAKRVVNAAGTHADIVAALFGDKSFKITARRGEYYIFDREFGGMFNRTVFRAPSKMGKGIIVSPTADGNLLLGPTAHDTEDRDDKSTTAAGLAEMAAASVRYSERLPFRNVITTFCGVRAVGDTGDFILTNPLPGFVNAAGIESPGLTSAPAIAEYIVDLLKKDGLELIVNENFNPIRHAPDHFKTLTDDEKNEIIRKHPEYGRIVCRCEGITEGEIVEAIRMNPPAKSLDAIKRRVRSGMGRCQGGFCSPSVMELISKELGIPMTDVTKHGGGSYICTELGKGGK